MCFWRCCGRHTHRSSLRQNDRHSDDIFKFIFSYEIMIFWLKFQRNWASIGHGFVDVYTRHSVSMSLRRKGVPRQVVDDLNWYTMQILSLYIEEW